MIFSGYLDLRDMTEMDERLLSLVGSGLLATIEQPDRDTRKRILLAKANSHHVQLSDGIANFLADSIMGDVRRIESCLWNLLLQTKLVKTGITMRMATEVAQLYATKELQPEG